MRTLNADQLKAVLSMESSLGHIHTLADVENTIDYLAKEEPEAVAGVEKFNIFDTMWSRKIQAAFPQSFVNMQNKLWRSWKRKLPAASSGFFPLR